MLAATDNLTSTLLSGLAGTGVVLLSGYVGSRMKKHTVVTREAELEAEDEKEEVDARLTTLETGHTEIMVVLKGRKRTWSEPEIVGLVELMNDIADNVRVLRNGGDHS